MATNACQTCHDIHNLQSRLEARPGLRAAGLDGQQSDQPLFESPQADRTRLAELGMDSAEIELWDVLAAAANWMYKLSTLHSMEAHERQHDFHKLELRLLARPGLRALGGPRQEADPR